MRGGGLFDFIESGHRSPTVNVGTVFIFHACVAAIVFLIIFGCSIALGRALVKPPFPKGWSGGKGGSAYGDPTDFDNNQGNRKSLLEYLTESAIGNDTPVNQFSVATATFGGIYTEDLSFLGSYSGSVDTEAARLQVEAGARAVIVDIWPNPADSAVPVVCAMLDNTEWPAISTWTNTGGLNKSVGHYSNWQKLTRNVVGAGDIITQLIQSAFRGGASQQNTDPFFLILKLHGAMTPDYLNRLGDSVKTAIGGNAMAPEWNRAQNQSKLCMEPISTFMSKAFVIVIPDIQQQINSLPNVNTYATFIPALLGSRLGEVTNAIEQNPNTMLFDPGSISIVTAATQPNCSESGPLQSIPQTGLCVCQPSIGGTSTRNSALYSSNSYSSWLQSGTQFVGVNLFSADGGGDKTLNQFFSEDTFGKFSFKKIG